MSLRGGAGENRMEGKGKGRLSYCCCGCSNTITTATIY